MKRLFILLLCFCMGSNVVLAQHQELKYGRYDDSSLPQWVQLMYAENPDIEAVMYAYQKHYETNEFVKNQHTQYYKHWIRNISRDINGLFSPNKDTDRNKIKANEQTYLLRSKAIKNQQNTQWQCIGPFDYDQDAAGRSYAPGAAHVYTMEQAASNTNTLYAGTATAGLFKSTDYGANWNLMTADLLVNGIRSIEIDPTDENTVYFGAAGQIYKTTDGGINWTLTGDVNFQSLDISVNDLAQHPASNTLYACTNAGLFVSTDAGTNWNNIFGGDIHIPL